MLLSECKKGAAGASKHEFRSWCGRHGRQDDGPRRRTWVPATRWAPWHTTTHSTHNTTSGSITTITTTTTSNNMIKALASSGLLTALLATTVGAQPLPGSAISAVPATCISWNDGCNTCRVVNGIVFGCTEMMCQRHGTPFCIAYDYSAAAADGGVQMLAPTLQGHADATTTGYNCCGGGGAACGFEHCPALGAGRAGCVQRWAMPNGMNFDSDCAAPAAVAPSSSSPVTGVITVGANERCAIDFCEDEHNCPRCTAGLHCDVPAGQMCAGTCFGTCVAEQQADDAITGHTTTTTTTTTTTGYNCCGGGVACGFEHCPALGAGRAGCVQRWAMPNGMNFDSDCAAPVAVAPPPTMPKPTLPAAPARPSIPAGCVSWHDGCNTCMVQNGQVSACTMMMCFQQATPHCLAFDAFHRH
jgi:hypothetical protein